MTIPKQFQSLMITVRCYNPDNDDSPSFESQSQREQRLQQQAKNDKDKAVNNLSTEIELVEAKIKIRSSPPLLVHLSVLQGQRNALLRYDNSKTKVNTM